MNVRLHELLQDVGVYPHEITGDFSSAVLVKAGHKLNDDRLSLLEMAVLPLYVAPRHASLAAFDKSKSAVVKHDDQLERARAVNRILAILLGESGGCHSLQLLEPERASSVLFRGKDQHKRNRHQDRANRNDGDKRFGILHRR